jgi:TatD DNase family protein
MNLIDTHCHINFDAYDADRDAVLGRSVEAGVRRIIIPSVDMPISRDICRLVAGADMLYGAVGVHPNSTADYNPAWLDELRALAAQPRIVAVGEIGLDYYWDDSPKSKQFEAFEAQLELAAQVGLPVIIHNRNASEDCLRILESWARTLPESLKDRPGVMHSFSGDMQIAERALAIGFYLGFSGPITYKNAEETRRVAAAAPLDRLLVETDGPFLTPVPYRGKRNEPAYIPYMVERLAALKTIPVEEMGAATTRNAEVLFRLEYRLRR